MVAAEGTVIAPSIQSALTRRDILFVGDPPFTRTRADNTTIREVDPPPPPKNPQTGSRVRTYIGRSGPLKLAPHYHESDADADGEFHLDPDVKRKVKAAEVEDGSMSR
jgi:hypothetical protein